MSSTGPQLAPSRTAPQRFGPWRREAGALLELLAVTAMTVARPTLGILSNNAEIFVTARTTTLELVVLVLLLLLVPPLALWLVEVAVGLVAPAARRATHVVLVAGVAGIFVVEVLKKQTSLSSAVLVVLAVAGAALGGYLLWRFRVVGLFLRYLAVAPVLFAALFATSGPVTDAVLAGDPEVARVEVRDPKRVVMVVLDELPLVSLLDGSGRIDPGLYPNLAALADTSTWYRNTTTVAPFTGAAVPALLTGQYRADAGEVQVAATAPENLFTLLGGTYDMNVAEHGTGLCPASLCDRDDDGAPARVGDLLSVSRELWWEHASPERVTEEPFADGDILGDPDALRTGERFVRTLRPTSKPRLDVVHVLLPHQQWHYLPSGQDYREVRTAPGLWWDFTWGSQWSADLAHQRHLLQTAAADRLVGDIVARLRAIGAYDDTLLVVTADHGIAFGDRVSIRGVTRTNYPQILWVPLLVKAPGQTAPVVDDRPARTIDVVPTIADHLGVRIPWNVDGRTLLGRPAPDGPRRVLDWSQNRIQPDRDGFVTVPGPPGFALARAGRASPAAGEGRDRLYRIGPYGDLLGRRAASLARRAAADASVTLDDPARFRDVRPGARDVPWRYVSGRTRGVAGDRPLAITVNGVVAGLSGTYRDPLDPDRTTFWGVLAPAPFRPGRNDVRVHRIEGPPDTPVLVPLRTSR
jgi:hypothetical protein